MVVFRRIILLAFGVSFVISIMSEIKTLGSWVVATLFFAFVLADLSERYWLRLGYRRSAFGYLAEDLLERDKREGRWIFRLVFLLVFMIFMIMGLILL